MTAPHLGNRSIASYNSLNRDLAAFNYVLRVTKPSGALHAHTLFTLNGLFNRANRLFRHHRDLPRFIQVDIGSTMSQADLAILVAQLTAACLAFEERHANLTETAHARAAARGKLEHLKA
jgi:hypothetical protein